MVAGAVIDIQNMKKRPPNGPDQYIYQAKNEIATNQTGMVPVTIRSLLNICDVSVAWLF